MNRERKNVMFLKNDQKRGNEELNCTKNSIVLAAEHIDEGNIAEAVDRLEDATRSAEEVKVMKDAKDNFDRNWLQIKQIEGGQQMADKIVAAMRLGR